METDPTIARIREARRLISAEHGHDMKRLVEYYVRLQEQYRDRIVEPRLVPVERK